MELFEQVVMKEQNNDRMADDLHGLFGDRILHQVKMDRFSSARVGGMADYVLVSCSAQQLEDDVHLLWKNDIPFILLGGASNVLISEKGIRGLVVINHARAIQIKPDAHPPTIYAESGALMSLIVKQAGAAALSGLEWGTALPGTLGGALYGNAGAFGSEISQNLRMAEILHAIYGKQTWTVKDFAFEYRASILKRKPAQPVVILSAELQLQRGDRDTINRCMEEFQGKRFRKQPPGACTGSMFKNPPGDYAGRLVEAAGLKGTKIGDVEISLKHGNFFINNGNGTADDFMALIKLARQIVYDKFGIHLELEVELIGDWENL